MKSMPVQSAKNFPKAVSCPNIRYRVSVAKGNNCLPILSDSG